MNTSRTGGAIHRPRLEVLLQTDLQLDRPRPARPSLQESHIETRRPKPISRSPRSQGAALGALLGAAHAVAECSGLWWYGVALKACDVGVLLISYSLLGAGAGACVAFVAGRFRDASDTAGTRRTLLAILVLCYVAAAFRIDRNADVSATISVAHAAGGLLVGLLWLRACDSLRGLAVGALAQTFFVSTTGLLLTESQAIAPDLRVSAYAQAASPILALLAALLGLSLLPRKAAIRRIDVLAACAIAALGVLQALAWNVWPPPPPSLHVLRDPPRRQPDERRKSTDVFLIVLDTVRADHLDLFGYDKPTMPLIADLVRRDFDISSVTMSTSPSSLPTHASMFTGLHAYRHGAHKPFIDDPHPDVYAYSMRSDVQTLAGTLSGFGFRTVGISGNYSILGGYGLGRDFGEYDVAPGIGDLAARLVWLRSLKLSEQNAAGLVRRLLPAAAERRFAVLSRYEPPDRRADEITGRTVRWLEQHATEPVFAFINYIDAHDPYVAPPQIEERFARRPPGVGWIGFPERYRKAIERGDKTLEGDELAYLIGLYDAELAFLDVHLARLFDELRRLDRYEDSLIFIVGDHGEEFLENGNLSHSSSLAPPQINVPLLVKLPRGMPDPPPSAAHMQFVDIYATVLGVLGLRDDTETQGSYFAQAGRPQLAENFCFRRHLERLCEEQEAVRADGWKYVQHATRSRPQGWTTFYDLASDPGERKPMSTAPAEVVATARGILSERERTIYASESAPTVSKRALDMLQQLGYVDSNDLGGR